MANPYPANFTDDSGTVREAGAITFTDAGNQPGGSFNGGTITNPLEITLPEGQPSATGLILTLPADFDFSVQPFLIQYGTTPLLMITTGGALYTADNNFTTGLGSIDSRNSITVATALGSAVHKLTTTEAGFFGANPVAQPTGVAVTAAGIHAALVSLGLITA